MRKMALAPLAAAVFILFSQVFEISSAWAYVPPAPFILKTMSSKHAGNKGLRVRSHWTVFLSEESGSEARAQTQFKITHLYQSQKGLLRSTLTDDLGQPIYSFESEVLGTKAPSDIPVQMIGGLLMSVHSTGILEVLGETTSLGRLNKSIAWVIGQSPQLWVEKDTFLPLRWQGRNQLEFQGYRLFKNIFYPRLISISHPVDEKKTVLKEELMDLKLDPSELLQREKAKDRVKPEVGFTEAGLSLPAPVREIIQSYFEAQP